MPTSKHYRINAHGARVYLSTDPALTHARNWLIALGRLEASGQSTLHLDIETYGTQVAQDDTPCDSDTAYKGAQWALGISLAGLVGLAAWALFSL